MPETASRQHIADSLATDVAAALRARLSQTGVASLAVSGGTTPILFLKTLSQQKLDWSRVTITLADDRCVPEDSPRSNASLVRENLLKNQSLKARFIPLMGALEQTIATLIPFAAIVLGMGLDGHTASLFPGADHLAEALTGPHLIQAISAPGVPEPRVTLTVPVLLGADFLALHIEGDAKLAALNAAMHPGPVADMPIRAVLDRPPRIYWCP